MWTIAIVVFCLFEANTIAPLLVQPSSESYCSELDQYFEDDMDSKMPGLRGQLRPVMISDTELEVEVWGGSGTARAAAALLYVIIRYGLRYSTELKEEDPNLCDLSRRAYDWTAAAVVAPISKMPITGCKIPINGMATISNLTGPAVTSDLLLFMYLAPAVRDICATTASIWTSYASANVTQHCLFAQSDKIGGLDQNDTCDDCVVILARNTSKNDYDVAQEYLKRLSTKHLRLKFYKSDLILHHEMEKLIKTNTSFLFIYEDLWSGGEGIYHIQPPHCNKSTEVCYNNINFISTFRLGDGDFFSEYAPEILEVVRHFAPNKKTLRQILEREETHFSIKEAACFWASNTSENEFKSWFNNKQNQTRYKIFLVLCDNGYYDVSKTIDPIRKKLKKANISDLEFDIIVSNEFDCNSTTDLIHKLRQVSEKKNTIGAVLGGWNDKINSAIKAAKIDNMLLIFAGPVPVTAETNLESTTCRSVSGNLLDLAHAYHNFFQDLNWYRIAIISEESDYAKSFAEALKFTRKFIWDEKITTLQKIHATLKEYQKLDARIFVVNAKWSLAQEILCIALRLDMTSNKYVWITREGHLLRCNGNKTVDDFRHFSVGLEWRGGILLPENYSIFEREEWIQFYNNSNNSEASRDNFVLPFSVFPVSNAIVRLVSAFKFFTSNYPVRRYVIHSPDSTALFVKTFDNNTSGLSNSTIVFIDEWIGDKLRSLGVWKVHNKTISSIMLLNNSIFDNNYKISDRPYCKISSGDPFAPRCHDVTVYLAIGALLLLVATFVLARRVRLARLARRDLFLVGTILEHRKHVASTLDTYLVDRSLVKLSHEIGSGCFGRVHFAELKRPGCDAVVVAAKEPHEGIALEEEREFLHEACILAPLSHEHVIRLIGICLKDGPPMVLMEHALHLDLQRYLIERRHLALKATRATSTENTFNDVSDESLTRLVRQAAAALDYLAERRLVHRDVRAANCLVDKERSLKLADFGMARQLCGSDPEYASRRRALFPVLWMAPESLEQGIFSPASDIWALGILTLEVVTLGARPFGSWPPARVLRHVTLGGHAPLPPDTSIYTRNLVTACWRRDPESRPSASVVQQYLKVNSQALSAALLAANTSTDS